MPDTTNATDQGQVGGADDATVNNNGAGQGNNNGAQEPTTYTQEDFDKALQSETDKRIQQAIETAKTKWQSEYEKKLQSEKDEAAKLAKLSAEDKAKALLEKEKQKFKEDQQKYNADRLEFECMKQLATEKLPAEFSKMLTGADADSTKANIDSFKIAFNKAIENAVNERLKGNPPKTNTNDNGTEETDPFLSGFNSI